MEVYYNGKIFTPNGIHSWMQIDNGKVVRTGDFQPPKVKTTINLQGQVVLPGLIDSHLHVFGIGRHLSVLRLKGCGSISELQTMLKEYASVREGWIEGRGWDQDIFEDKRYPNKKDIDQIVSEQPVILFRGCHHICVVNSRALEIAGIDFATENPDGGEIERDSRGEPTGILKENALKLVTPFIKQSRESKKEMIANGLQQCLEMGLTTVQPNDGGTWDIYQELQEEGRVPIRVYLTLNHEELGKEGSPKPGSVDGMLSFDRVKLFADGSLGAQTAAMREPYADTGKLGIPIYQQEEMNRLVQEASKYGSRVEIHAIGDRAAEIVINAIETNQLFNRPILTHAQILGRDLIERMSNLGIIANIQPPFIITDGVWVDKRIGENSERRKYSYAWKTLLDRGVKVAGGSDAPIESNNPLLGLYSSIYREDVNGEVFREEECLSFEAAVKIYTEGGAYATIQEHRIGKLEAGYEADFIILDRDILEDNRRLADAEVIQVFVSGVQKFSKKYS